MNFTAWQIDRLRRGLIAYRVARAANGRLRPWKVVLDDLVLSKETSLSYGKEGQPPSLREEALRRFAKGESVLPAATLDDLRRFLIEARTVKPEEFEVSTDDDAELLALRAFMANTTPEAKDRLRRFAARYAAATEPKNTLEWITLDLAPETSGDLVRVEERYRRLVPEEQIQGRGTRALMREAVRRGYGFLSTQLNLLHVFVRGASQRDRIHYVEIAGLSDFASPLLHRVGALAPGYVERPEGGAILKKHDLNVYAFNPESVAEAVKGELP